MHMGSKLILNKHTNKFMHMYAWMYMYIVRERSRERDDDVPWLSNERGVQRRILDIGKELANEGNVEEKKNGLIKEDKSEGQLCT